MYVDPDALESGRLTEQTIKQRISDSELAMIRSLTEIAARADHMECKLTTAELNVSRVSAERSHQTEVIKRLKKQIDELQKTQFALQFELEEQKGKTDTHTRVSEDEGWGKRYDRPS